MKILRTSAFKVFMLLTERLAGKGWGGFKPIGAIYGYLRRILMPKQDFLLDIQGHKMFVHGQHSKGDCDELPFTNSYEKEQTILFRKLVDEGMNVVDIGANIGYYTLLAAELVGEKGKVFAFEPEPSNYDLLLRNVEINGYKNVTVVRKAVSNETGESSLFLSQKGFGQHSLYDSAGSGGTITVDAVSLDDFFEGEGYPIDIIKIDIEGAEMAALLGMSRVLRKNENVKLFIELSPVGFQRTGFSPREFWDKLMEYNFNFVYLINEPKRRIEPADFDSAMTFCKGSLFRKPTYVNLLCAKAPLEKRLIIDAT